MAKDKVMDSYNFILSNWYSGATVYSILMNNHKSITCNGETFPFPGQDLEKLRCSCGKTIINCDFYKFATKHFKVNDIYNRKYFNRIPIVSEYKVLQRVFNSYFYFPEVRDFLCNFIRGYPETIETFIDLHDKFHALACEYSQTSVYLDGTKSLRRVEIFAKHGNKPIRVLHSIRDGRKFIASYSKVHGKSIKEFPNIAKKWVDYIKMVELLPKRFPNIEIKVIRHEDLCHEKDKTIRESCDFLGVEYDSNIYRFTKNDYHVLGNELKNKFDGNICENTNWRSLYTDKIFEEITELLKGYLIKYNYL